MLFKRRPTLFAVEVKTAEFMAFVEIGEDGCWRWSGSTNKGYPLFEGEPASHFILAEAGYPRTSLHYRAVQICEHKHCVCPDHLVWRESQRAAQRRYADG